MAAAAEMMKLRGVFDVSLSLHDVEIERRPYHRNCDCALHKLKGVCSSGCYSKQNTISFPKKKSWTDCLLSMAAAAPNHNFSSQTICSLHSDTIIVCHQSEQTRLEETESLLHIKF